MPGFNPVGSTPVGAIGGAPPSGNSYTPATGGLIFSGSVPDLTTGTAKILPLLLGQFSRESLVTPGNGEKVLAVSQLSRESLIKPGGTSLTVSQMVREALIISGGGGVDDTIISIIW